MPPAGPSRRLSTDRGPPPSKPKTILSSFRDSDIWGLGLSSDLLPDDRSSIFPAASSSSSASRISKAKRSPEIPIKPQVNPALPSRDSSVRRRSRASSGDLLHDAHPLFRSESPPKPVEGEAVEVLGDVSRPSLRRLTSDIERRAGSSRGNASEDGSRRGSMERVRPGSSQAREVEVLVHQVKANESIAGIALLYGIDIATLRKTNKLWASDPVHLRSHLYVPLEACHWNKAKETLVRGPGEGQVTLVSKVALVDNAQDDQIEGKGKGKDREPATDKGNLIDLNGDSPQYDALRLDVDLIEASDPWAEMLTPTLISTALPSPPLHLGTTPPDPSRGSSTMPKTQSRVLDIVRLPASQLQFFPRPAKPPDSSRSSIDSDLRRSLSFQRQLAAAQGQPAKTRVSPGRPSLSIQNDMHYSHSEPLVPSKPKSHTVKLRPPSTYQPSTSGGLADRLTGLFVVPPPPATGLAAPSIPSPRVLAKGSPRISLDSSSVRSSPRRSARSSAAGSPTRGNSKLGFDELEMFGRSLSGSAEVSRRDSMETLRINGATSKMRAFDGRRKLD